MFAFSKKIFKSTMVLICLCMLCCESLGPESTSKPRKSHSRDVKQGGGWLSRFGKSLKELVTKNKTWTVVLSMMFLIGITAFFVPFTCINEDLGKHVFGGDQGSSMWLRLAVGLSCLTLSIGVFSTACVTAIRHTNKTGSEQQYNDWVNGDNETKWIKKTTSHKFLMAFFACLFVFGFVCMLTGAIQPLDKNWNDVMFHFAWIPALLIGAAGFTVVLFKHRGYLKLLAADEEHQTVVNVKDNQIALMKQNNESLEERVRNLRQQRDAFHATLQEIEMQQEIANGKDHQSQSIESDSAIRKTKPPHISVWGGKRKAAKNAEYLD